MLGLQTHLEIESVQLYKKGCKSSDLCTFLNQKVEKAEFYNLPFDAEMSLHPDSPRQKAEQSYRTSFAYKYTVEAIKGREGNPSLPGALTGRHDGGHQQ